MKGSDVYRRGKSSDPDPYWKACLFCRSRGKTPLFAVTEAHIVNGIKHGLTYSSCNTTAGYKDDLQVDSNRNYVPLCGTLGQAGSCHHLFDLFKLAILWNPFGQFYYLYDPNLAADHVDNNVRLTGIPDNCKPYRRLLAARAMQSGLREFDRSILLLPNATLQLDTQSLASSHSGGSTGGRSSSSSGGADKVGTKRNWDQDASSMPAAKSSKRGSDDSWGLTLKKLAAAMNPKTAQTV